VIVVNKESDANLKILTKFVDFNTTFDEIFHAVQVTVPRRVHKRRISLGVVIVGICNTPL
jgi:hypothetical protein